jgi:hypothetical protein
MQALASHSPPEAMASAVALFPFLRTSVVKKQPNHPLSLETRRREAYMAV